MGDYLVAAIGSAAIFLVLLVFGAVRSDTRMLLIIRADGAALCDGEAR